MQFIETLREHSQVLQVIGVLGFLLYVGAFSAIQAGWLCGNGILFSVNKVVAASCVLVGLVGALNLASFLIQVSYIGIGTYGITLFWRHTRSLRPRLSQPQAATGLTLTPSA